MSRGRVVLSVLVVACGGAGTGEGGSGSGVTHVASESSGGAAVTSTGASLPTSEIGETGEEAGGTSETGATPGETGTTEGPEPPPACEDSTTTGDGELPADYGYAVAPPRMVLADTFYTYDLRTNIGDCATDRVEWTFVAGPASARLELPGVDTTLAPGEVVVHEDGGAAREEAKVAWEVGEGGPECVDFTVRWRAWRDCGFGEEGVWGPEVTQAWSVAVRANHWYSGDLHVHTKHSERGEEAGSVFDYVRRMRNEATNDAGQDFADRRRRSLRGRLHWLVFTEHTNNEMEECGRHFASWCVQDAGLESATGREVVREYTEQLGGDVLLVVGAEVSNKFDGHFGFLPKNPFPGHPIYAPGYVEEATEYEYDAGYGAGVIRERWVDEAAENSEEIAQIRAMGGLAIVNHEAGPALWVEYDWSTSDIDGLEVWNGGNRHDQFDDSAYNGDIDLNEITKDDALTAEIPEAPIERSWLGLIKTGRWPVVLVGGSDVHDFNEVVCYDGPCDPTNQELALPTTTVWAPSFVWADGVHGVGDGLASGRVVVHDVANFIDLRVTYHGAEYLVGETIAGYVQGEPLEVRAFGRVAEFVDGDNRVLLILGTRVDAGDPSVDVLYNSEDSTHFVEAMLGKDHMRYIRPDSSFDRAWTTMIDDLGPAGAYVIWAQFVPWHNPVYLVGNGQDMALTGAVRLVE